MFEPYIEIMLEVTANTNVFMIKTKYKLTQTGYVLLSSLYSMSKMSDFRYPKLPVL